MIALVGATAVAATVIGLAGSATATERQPNLAPMAVDVEHPTKAKRGAKQVGVKDCIPFIDRRERTSL
jgi:hypothetical protein